MKYSKNGNVRFNLKKKTDKKGNPVKTNLQIWLTFNFENNRLRYYTGKRTDQKYWNESNQRIKAQHPDAILLNGYLNELATLVDSKYTKAEINDERITLEDLKNALDERRRKIDS